MALRGTRKEYLEKIRQLNQEAESRKKRIEELEDCIENLLLDNLCNAEGDQRIKKALKGCK